MVPHNPKFSSGRFRQETSYFLLLPKTRNLLIERAPANETVRLKKEPVNSNNQELEKCQEGKE
jgi:hypothetical protein